MILLMVLTLLAISGMNTATVELQMAGNMQYSQNAFQAAETGIELAMASGSHNTARRCHASHRDHRYLTPTRPPLVPMPNGTTPVPTGGYSMGGGTGSRPITLISPARAPRRAMRLVNTQSFYVVGPSEDLIVTERARRHSMYRQLISAPPFGSPSAWPMRSRCSSARSSRPRRRSAFPSRVPGSIDARGCLQCKSIRMASACDCALLRRQGSSDAHAAAQLRAGPELQHGGFRPVDPAVVTAHRRFGQVARHRLVNRIGLITRISIMRIADTLITLTASALLVPVRRHDLGGRHRDLTGQPPTAAEGDRTSVRHRHVGQHGHEVDAGTVRPGETRPARGSAPPIASTGSKRARRRNADVRAPPAGSRRRIRLQDRGRPDRRARSACRSSTAAALATGANSKWDDAAPRQHETPSSARTTPIRQWSAARRQQASRRTARTDRSATTAASSSTGPATRTGTSLLLVELAELVLQRAHRRQDAPGDHAGSGRGHAEPLSDVNVGLMRFSSDGEGGMVLHEMAHDRPRRATGARCTRATISAADGNTPLSETMLEAHLYWAGDTSASGLRQPRLAGSDSVNASRSAERTLHSSPLGNACQKNFIVLLTDGDPTDTGRRDDHRSLPIRTLGNLTTGNAAGTCTENGGRHRGAATTGDGSAWTISRSTCSSNVATMGGRRSALSRRKRHDLHGRLRQRHERLGDQLLGATARAAAVRSTRPATRHR